MSSADFRKELVKIMPGYKWTVHKPSIYSDEPEKLMIATGIQTSGFNRLSTLEVKRCVRNAVVSYEARSAGYGCRAKWLATSSGKTLAQALRGLQDHYERVAQNYRVHAEALIKGRKSEVIS